MLEMGLQIVLAVLLLVSIGWSALLHRRLSALRQGGDGIARFVGDLMGATRLAETATKDMRVLAGELARQWQRQRGEGDSAAIELKRLTLDAEAVARELGRVASAGVDAKVGLRHAPARPAAIGVSTMPQAAGPDVSGSCPHERIRQAIKDLR